MSGRGGFVKTWSCRLVMAMKTPWCTTSSHPHWINLPPENLRSARKLGRAEMGAAKALGSIAHRYKQAAHGERSGRSKMRVHLVD